MRKNILFINLKGGAGKTTGSSIAASYLQGAKLIEIDKINESDARINSKGYYDSIQCDFNNEQSDSFFEFENMLLDDGVKIIDVGAVKLEIFHRALSIASLYDTIDLLVIPAMDGRDDFNVAMDYLETIKDLVQPKKIMFGFNRYNESEYDGIEEQFEDFFLNADVIKSEYNVTLKESNFYVLKDSRAVKRARKQGVTVKSLADKDLAEITKQQRSEQDRDKRLQLTKERGLVNSAQRFETDYILPMVNKISYKLK